MKNEADAEELNDSVWKHSAFGEEQKLLALLQSSPELAQQPDGGEHLPLQWAALNARTQILHLLLSFGADANDTGAEEQTALHWACVRGDLHSISILISNGASPTIADMHGFTPAHVLAQWNHPLELHALKHDFGADIDLPDHKNRSPLTWAAYKHHSNCVKVLMLHKAQLFRPDTDGCTALHWACISGSADVALMLTRAAREPLVALQDGHGHDCMQLARKIGNDGIAMRLSSEVKQQRARASRGYRLLPAVGTIALIAGMLLPYLLSPIPGGEYVLLSGCTAIVLLLYVYTSDPGIVSKSLPAGSGTKGALANHRFDRICPTCRILQPAGTKHCSVLDRCIRRFDHYCPYVGNSVGKLNRRAFLLFVLACDTALCLSLVCTCWLLLAIASLNGNKEQSEANVKGISSRAAKIPIWFVCVYLVADLALLVSVSTLLVAQLVQVAQNITTNEQQNAHRYPHMQQRGQFFNPFDRGLRSNCHGFWCGHDGNDGTNAVEFAEPAPKEQPVLTGMETCEHKGGASAASRRTASAAAAATKRVQHLPKQLGMITGEDDDDVRGEQSCDAQRMKSRRDRNGQLHANGHDAV